MLFVVEDKYIEVPKKFIEDSEFLSGVLECDEGAKEIAVPNVSYKTMEDTIGLHDIYLISPEKYLNNLEHDRFIELLKCIDYLLINCLLEVVVDYISKKENKNYVLIDLVLKHLDKPWDMALLSQNPNITLDVMDKFTILKWNEDNIIHNQNISVECLLERNNNTNNYMQIINLLERCGMHLLLRSDVFPELIEKYLNKELYRGWYYLSKNRDLPPEFIEKNIDRKWDWNELSKNQNITLEFIEKHINKNWDWRKLSENKNITPEFVLKHNNKNWRWEGISYNIDITYLIDKCNKLHWSDVSNNKYITIDTVLKYIDKPWNWSKLSQNRNFTMDIIEKNIDMPWDWSQIPANPNATVQFIEKYIDKFYDLDSVEYGCNLSLELVDKYPKIDWNWDNIHENNNLTIEFLDKHYSMFPDYWHYISTEFPVTIDIIEKYPSMPWIWKRIACNLYISAEFIEKYIDKWDGDSWEYLSNNPRLTTGIVNRHADKPWNWGILSGNEFIYENKMKKIVEFEEYPKIIAKKVIDKIFENWCHQYQLH